MADDYYARQEYVMPSASVRAQYILDAARALRRSPDQDIIDRYSTPGLKQNQLTRSAKRAQLDAAYKMTQDERDKLLDTLYPPTGTTGESAMS